VLPVPKAGGERGRSPEGGKAPFEARKGPFGAFYSPLLPRGPFGPPSAYPLNKPGPRGLRPGAVPPALLI